LPNRIILHILWLLLPPSQAFAGIELTRERGISGTFDLRGSGYTTITETCAERGTGPVTGAGLPGLVKSEISAGPRPFDVLINEIMVRPGPPSALPEVEYIELYNRSGNHINLQNWTITVGNSSRIIHGETIMEPGGFLLITHEKHISRLEIFGQVAGIASFPLLPSGGQSIVLRDESANVISAIRYSDKWYRDDFKTKGGWSLELIDPFNPCGGAMNWIASTDPQGGTPGRENSVKGSNPDRIAPRALRATMLSESGLRLHFSEPLHPSADWSPGQFIAEGPGAPLYSYPVKPFYDAVDLYFGGNLEGNTIYKLHIQANTLFDCAGNFLNSPEEGIRFAIPSSPDKGDIIINEILFDPLPGGAAFIEMVNISRKTLDLKQLLLAGSTGDQPESTTAMVPGGFLFFPDQYLVVTTDPEKVMDHYYCPSPDLLVRIEKWPRMNRQNGRLVISGLHMQILEDVSYSAGMHSPLLANTKGVSLERIEFARPSHDPSNWHSATENSGFATPGYLNSQQAGSSDIKKGSVKVEPGIFFPDRSNDHEASIIYQLDKPGYAGTITIFDASGRLVRRLARNELLGTSGIYTWDGRNEANFVTARGIYIILMEVFHPDGDTGRYKETVVLAR
jgi:hypothetical protein